MVDVEIKEAGWYKVLTPDPGGREYEIVNLRWGGPREVSYPCWECRYFDPGHGWTIDGNPGPANTLKEARELLGRLFKEREEELARAA